MDEPKYVIFGTPGYRIWPLVIVGILVLWGFVNLFLAARSCWASGNYRITWTQAADCEYVDHWQLEVYGVPHPDLFVGACGGAMSQVAYIAGVGPTVFRMRAVNADGFTSDYSNGIGEDVPFVAPGLTAVERVTDGP